MQVFDVTRTMRITPFASESKSENAVLKQTLLTREEEIKQLKIALLASQKSNELARSDLKKALDYNT